MPEHIVTRSYEGLRGFTTDSMYNRPANVADKAINMARQPDGTFAPRRGYQIRSANIGGLGCKEFTNANQELEKVCIHSDGNLYSLKQGSMTISYTGSSFRDYVTYEIYVDEDLCSDPPRDDFGIYDVVSPTSQVSDSINFKFSKNGSLLFDQQMGKGYGISSPYSIIQLINQLQAQSGVSVSYTGDTSKPAAFLAFCEPTNIGHQRSATLYWYYWKSVNRVVASTFSGLAASVDRPDFEIASMAPYGKVIYICNIHDYPQKYDGQTVYRAGMPNGSTPSVSTGSATGLTGSYEYAITYEFIDHVGTLVEGTLSARSAPLTVTDQKINVTVDNLVAGSGWNTNGAVVDGNQGPVTTILVDSATHTLRVGDEAYFIDSSGSEQTRLITAISPDSITIEGSAVTVLDGQPISNQLKINIWRNVNGGTELRLVKTLANNAASSTQTFIDDVSDSTLADRERYPELERQPDPPPKTAYVVAFQNLLVYIKDPDSEDTVWFSDAEQPEYVDSVIQNFILPANDDELSGGGVSGSSLVIFKGRSIFSVSGDLAQLQFVVTPVAPGSNIGCVAHATIASIGGLLYFCSASGVYSMSETQIYPTDSFGSPLAISKVIDSLFIQDDPIVRNRYQFKRATAVNYTRDKQYLLFLPCENNPDDSTSPKASTTRSRVLCYDYEGKNWFEWTNVNAAGGWIVSESNLFWQDRTISGNGHLTANFYQQNRNYRLIDQVDHVMPIRVTFGSSWEDLGQPKVRKKFIRMVLLFDNVTENRQLNPYSLAFRTFLNWQEITHTFATVQPVVNANAFSTTPWSMVGYDGYRDNFYRIALRQGTVADSLKFQVQTNKMRTFFKLQGFQIEISPDFAKTMTR